MGITLAAPTVLTAQKTELDSLCEGFDAGVCGNSPEFPATDLSACRVVSCRGVGGFKAFQSFSKVTFHWRVTSIW